jgi:iron complex outermembrane receptor protein
MRPFAILSICFLAAAVVAARPAAAENADAHVPGNVLAELSIEQLMAIDVSAVSGSAQDLFSTPAAVYVIDVADIEHAGLRTLPDALRLAPGTYVGRIDANSYAIGIRGFTNTFTNKLQVAMDGRILYDPLFQGVFWEAHDLLMDNVDQIEVIRGPGSTLYGTNAVNGVISIRTKPADQTQGLYLTGGYGTWMQGLGGFRYGDAIDSDTHYRVWGKYKNYKSTNLQTGADNRDEWDMTHMGGRLDHAIDDQKTLTVQVGMATSDRVGDTGSDPIPGGAFQFRATQFDRRYDTHFVLGRLQHEDDERSWELQAYWDHFDFADGPRQHYRRHTFALNWEHHFKLNSRHEIAYGLGGRVTADSFYDELGFIRFDPPDKTLHDVDLFIQDQITLLPERLKLTLGTKVGHNTYTGVEVQPSGRIAWTPHTDHTVWASLSRAVRTPSRIDREFSAITAFAPPGPPFNPVIFQGSDVESETVIAAELGYRVNVTDRIRVDVATFANDYDDLIQPDANNVLRNTGGATTYGGELAVDWRPADDLTVHASYSMIRFDSDVSERTVSLYPKHQAQVRVTWQPMENLQLHSATYFVDENDSVRSANAFVRLDLGLTWQINDRWELSVWGQNLLDPQHPEFGDGMFNPVAAEIPRSAYFQLTTRW